LVSFLDGLFNSFLTLEAIKALEATRNGPACLWLEAKACGLEKQFAVFGVRNVFNVPHVQATLSFEPRESKSLRGMTKSSGLMAGLMVEAVGFEPTTFCSQSRRAARLRYASTGSL
jgi:hypothetical protein